MEKQLQVCAHKTILDLSTRQNTAVGNTQNSIYIICLLDHNRDSSRENLVLGFLTRYDSNRHAQLQSLAIVWKTSCSSVYNISDSLTTLM